MSTLTGRENQLNKLQTVLQSAIQGKLQTVFVTGEAGVGKTTLVAEFIKQAKQQIPDLVVANSKCQDVAGSQQEPYSPFIEILQAILAEKQSNSTWDIIRRSILELGPDWAEQIPGIGSLIGTLIKTVNWVQGEFRNQEQGADLNRRLVQYVNILRVASKTAPLLLWIDDLHWSDSATVDLISFLADHAHDIRAMLITTYRPMDISHQVQGQPHPVKRLVDKLKRYQQGIEIAISVLTLDDVKKFLELSKYNFSQFFIEQLHRQSGGNPLFIKEYLKLLHDRRVLKRERGIFVLNQPEIQIEIPTTVQSVIEQRLSLIENDLRRVLLYASVQGERFASKILTQLLAAPELDLLERLNLLERVHNLIHELEEQHLVIKVGTEYQFIHILIQQVLYNDLSDGQRRQLHLTIAQLLENLYGENANQYATDLASHFERGRDIERAIHYYLQASNNALAVFSLDDAILHIKNAQRLIAQLATSQQTLAWQIQSILQITEIHYWKAEYEAVLESSHEGENLCQQGNFPSEYASLLYWRCRSLYSLERRGDAIDPIRKAIQILNSTSANKKLEGYLHARVAAMYRALSTPEVQHSIEAALAIAESENLPNVKVQVMIQKGWVDMNRTDEPEEALRIAQETLPITEQYSMIDEQIECHSLIAFACRRLKYDEQAVFHSQKAVELARQSGLPRALHMALHGLSTTLKEINEDWVNGFQAMQESVVVANEYHFPVSLAVYDEWANFAIGLGLWLESEKINDECRKSIDPSYPRAWGIYHYHVGNLAYARGMFHESTEAYQRAFSIQFEHGSDIRESKAVSPYLGLALAESGDFQQATSCLEDAYEYWKSRQTHCSFARILQGLARVNFFQGNLTQALTYLENALAIIKGSNAGGVWPVWPHVCIHLGQVLFKKGEYEHALEPALTGYEKFKRIRHYLFGEASFLVGQILVAQGKQNEALVYLQDAHDDWQRLELTYHLPKWEKLRQDYEIEIN